MIFLKRSEWGSGVKATKVVAHPVTSQGGAVKTVVLHHSVTGRSPSLDRARAIESYHQGTSTSFYDLAYNFMLSAVDGNVFEGRGALVQGGATGKAKGKKRPEDETSLSVCAIGNFEDSEPPQLLLNNLVDLLGKLVADGHVAPDFVLRPHSDFKATACCGKHLAAEIPSLVGRVRHLAKPVVKPVVVVGKPEGVGVAPVAYSDAAKLAWIKQILDM
jgi:hypothetical protein